MSSEMLVIGRDWKKQYGASIKKPDGTGDWVYISYKSSEVEKWAREKYAVHYPDVELTFGYYYCRS